MLLNAYLTAFTLGSVHAVEVDHMVAVSVFAGWKPRLKAAARYGARWGLGHAAVVVVVGGLLAWSGVKVPASVMQWSEVAVGVALIALGCWALRKGRRFHLHPPQQHDADPASLHGHLHAHNGAKLDEHEHQHRQHNPRRHHQHLPTAMGALHGLAGSAPVLALIPITLLDNVAQALMYLAFFSIGTTAAMTAYAAMAAAAIQGLALTTARIRAVTTAIALVTMAVGLWWVVQAF